MWWLLLLMLDGPVSVSAVENLRLGESGEDIELFSATASVVTDKTDTMYVLDPGNMRVVVFNETGEYQRHFGRKGQGPGEFAEPLAFTINDQGQLLIFDTGHHKMIVLDNQGEFVREVRFASSIHGVYLPISIDDAVAFTAYKLDKDFQFSYDLSIYDAALNPLKTLHATSMPKLDWDQAEQPSFWVGFLKDQFELNARGFPFAAKVDGRFVTTLGTQYRGDLTDAKGVSVGSFEGDLKPRPLSDEAKEAFCEPIWQQLAANPVLARGLTFPVFERAVRASEALQKAPAIFMVFSYGSEFGVLTDFDVLKSTGRLDFFDASGAWKRKAEYAGPYAYLYGDGRHVFAAGPNEDGDTVVVRYSVK